MNLAPEPSLAHLCTCGGEQLVGVRHGRKGGSGHEVRTSSNRRESKSWLLWSLLGVARTYGHGQWKVGQPRVPGPRRAARRRAHAAVLAPRVRGDRPKSLGHKRRPWTGGAVPQGGAERATRSERPRDGRGSSFEPGEVPCPMERAFLRRC